MGKKGGKRGGAASASGASKRAEKKAARKQRHRQASTWRDNYDDFGRQLRALGLRMRDVAPDGNCLFRSISDQLDGSQDAHAAYRQRVVQFMEGHRDDFAPFLEEDFDEYCAEMRESGTWGGNMELVAAARCLDRNITVHQLGAPRLEVTNYDNPAAPHLHLSYHNGEHYMSVRRLKDADEGDAAARVELRLPGDSASPVGGLSRDELVVQQSTGCLNVDLLREALRDNWNDVDATVEYLVSARDSLGAAFYEPRDAKAEATAAAAAPAAPAAKKKKKTRKELKAEKKARARAAKLASVYDVPAAGGGGGKAAGGGKPRRLQDMSNKERKAFLAAQAEREAAERRTDRDQAAVAEAEAEAALAADLGTVCI